MGVAVAGSRGSGRSVHIQRPHLYLVPAPAEGSIPRPRAVTEAAAGELTRPATAHANPPSRPRITVDLPPRMVPGPRPVRLTRRGRVVVVLFLLGLMVGVAVLLSTASQASPPPGPDRTVVVHTGDTLWSISVAALPGANPDAAMAQIRRLNHMTDNTIYVGEQLILPPTR